MKSPFVTEIFAFVLANLCTYFKNKFSFYCVIYRHSVFWQEKVILARDFYLNTTYGRAKDILKLPSRWYHLYSNIALRICKCALNSISINLVVHLRRPKEYHSCKSFSWTLSIPFLSYILLNIDFALRWVISRHLFAADDAFKWALMWPRNTNGK